MHGWQAERIYRRRSLGEVAGEGHHRPAIKLHSDLQSKSKICRREWGKPRGKGRWDNIS